MQCELFDDASAYAAQVTPFLLQHEAANCLPLGLCSTLQHNPYAYGDVFPFLALVREQGVILAAAMMTLPYNLAIAYSNNFAAIDLLADAALVRHPELPGVLACNAIADYVAARWQQQTGRLLHLSMAERIYQLDQVQAVRAVSGRMRPIGQADREQISAWLYAFFLEATSDSVSQQQASNIIDDALAGRGSRRCFVWEDNSLPVSLAAYASPTPHSMRIGPVYTPPELRGRGYASACVAALSQDLLDNSCDFVTLFTDLANPTSNHIYQAIGYRRVIDVNMYQFG